MNEQKKLLCIFAHPDDETLGMGPAVARYAAEGVEVSLISATRGERGWFGDASTHPGYETLGAVREAELLAAARVLGISRVDFLDVLDGDVDKAETDPLVEKITRIIREVRPQVVVSFGPDGIYGHPDHIAISQLAGASIMSAADPQYLPGEASPHRVLKFYFMVAGERVAQAYSNHGLNIEMGVSGVIRTLVAWPEWSITTRIHAEETIPIVREAIHCHQTQLPSLDGMENMPNGTLVELMGTLDLYRAFSLVNRPCEQEDDLFHGIS